MNLPRVLILAFLIIITFLITNLPDFHLDEYVFVKNSHLKDIALHGSYYFVASFVAFLLLRNSKLPTALVCLLLIVPALFEFSQVLIRGRTLSAYDMLGNYLGIATALSICFFIVTLLGEGKKKTKLKP